MEMKCPHCEVVGGLVATHRHLLDAHMDQVTTERDEATGKMAFVMTCPFCTQAYRRQLKPRNRNPHFLEEFKAEIALVAFDQLLYHILQEHPANVGVDPAELHSLEE